MHPYAAKQLVRRLRDADSVSCAGDRALADLEVWCRGGADYGDELAFTLALRRGGGRAGLSYFAAPAASRGGFGLLAGAGVLVHGALLHGLVDPRDERAVLGLDRARVAGLDSALEPAEMGLDRARQQPVLGALALAA